MRLLPAFLLLPFATAALAQSQPAPLQKIVYPATQRGNTVETSFGERVADPYRWLENDVRQDPRVRDWVTAQNAATNAFLSQLPSRAAIRARMTQLYNYEKFGVPKKAGNFYFYTRNDGLQNQAGLYVREGLTGTPRLLIDPNTWSGDGATALADWDPSADGRYLLYGIQDGGTDWRILRVVDVASGRQLPDEIRWVKFSSIDWAKDGSGFFYSRFPQPSSAGQFQATNENHAIYFHRLGTQQRQDVLVFATPDRPRLSHTGEVSEDGKWLIVTSTEGTDARHEISLVDISTRGFVAPRRIITGFTHEWDYLGNSGDTFYWRTNNGAPRQRIVATDTSLPMLAIREIVPEDAATLDDASIVGRQLIGRYLVDAKSEVRTFTLEGRRAGTIRLPDAVGNVGGFDGHQDSNEAFYSFTSFARPTAIYRYDSATGRTTPFAEPRVAFNPRDFTVRQVFYTSRDGTRVPMFLVHRRGLNTRRPNPTLLYAYGGFNATELPRYQPRWLTWVDMGGVLAVANIRGGGEYGQAWHDAGRRANKQNGFDDFIAAGEYLIAQRITSRQHLAIEGRSNGGLLVGAVVNQRPDLFAAALPTVGVMDMLRFDRFTAGRYWVDDYGYPNREADWRVLRAYSPYHNIRAGVRYPPVLATTADTDDRVVPGHSFKYISALQHANPNGAPHLIRIETRAGHGTGKPTDKQIEEFTDMYAFVAHFTGLRVPEPRPARRPRR